MAAADTSTDINGGLVNRQLSLNSSTRTRHRSLKHVRDSSEDLRRKAGKPGDGSLELGAARGKQFRVGTISADGLIYLRPVRRPHPASIDRIVGPITPPETPHANHSFLIPEPDRDWRGSVFSGSGTMRSSFDPRQAPDDHDLPVTPPESMYVRRRDRSNSFSTIDEQGSSSRGHTVKIIVNRASPKRREDGLGIKTGSSPDNDVGSSVVRHDFSSNGAPPSSFRSVSHDGSSMTNHLTQPAKQRRTLSSDLLPAPAIDKSTAVEKRHLKEKTDISAVRRSAATGRLVGATADQLIAQVTSPNILDYDLLSDFFLTYRFFLSPDDLMLRLFKRLRWAIDLGDDYGRVVRVRTFVALRHWILNYFVADFVMNFDLRLYFSDLINQICRNLCERGTEADGDLNILNQLKKCWRRTVALYWDTGDLMREDSALVDVTPGGYVGSREPVPYPGPVADAAELEKVVEKKKSGGLVQGIPSPIPDRPVSFVHAEDNHVNVDSATASEARPEIQPRVSESSAHVVSCSVPVTSLQKTKKYLSGSLAPRPAQPHTVASRGRGRSPVSAITRSPRTSGYFEDAVPTADPRLERPMPVEPQLPTTILPGSLIRGLILTPEMPYVEGIPPGTPSENLPEVEAETQREDGPTQPIEASNLPQGPGVRGFIKSMKRALSNRRHRSPSKLTDSSTKPVKASKVSGGRVSRSASRSGLGVSRKRLVNGRAKLRIDLLAAGIAEAFKEAVREEQEAQRRQREQFQGGQPQPGKGHERGMSSAAEPTLDPSMLDSPKGRKSNTLASRAIRIMDDTGTVLSSVPNIVLPSSTGDWEAQDGTHSKTPSNIDPLHELFATLKVDQRPTSQTSSMPSAAVPQHRKVQSREEALKRLESSDRLNPLKANPTAPTSPAENDESKQLETPNDTAGSPAQSETANVRLSTTSPTSKRVSKSSTELSPAPSRPLRRRPGGDLRAVDNVEDLKDNNTISTGSLAAVPHHVSVPTRKTSQKTMQEHAANTAATKGNTIAAGGKNGRPKLNPSFEAQVARLAQLPDDEFDDGGRESTLLKLEGRYERSSGAPSPSSPSYETFQGGSHVDEPTERQIRVASAAEKRQNREEPVVNGQSDHSTAPATHLSTPPPRRIQSGSPATQIRVKSVASSDDSNSSVPLLQRGISQYGSDGRSLVTRSTPATQVPTEPRSETTAEDSIKPDSHDRKGKQASNRAEEHRPTGKLEERSFFLDAKQDPTNQEQEQENEPSRSEVRSFYNSDSDSRLDIDEEDDDDDDADVNVTPVEMATLDHIGANQASPQSVLNGRPLVNGGYIHDRPYPPQQPKRALSKRQQVPQNSRSENDLHQIPSSAPISSTETDAHLPFILGCSSEILAEQLTLIEKDALGEIDWRELIECRWSQAPNSVSSWVDFLRMHAAAAQAGKQSVSGVDICIARNNVVVKWASSEIVLTQDLHERAATIVKYIHIAQHARRLRNWATMFQMTLALISADIARLKQTWVLVPEEERKTLRKLENLILPTRNFQALRTEMETALATDTSASQGCIPFIGIYTHDLVYNAQKPLYLQRTSGEPGTELLVNFERHHTAASIVKDLLRVFEASSRYNFEPQPDVLSKCLWMAALRDDEITRRSLSIEP